MKWPRSDLICLCAGTALAIGLVAMTAGPSAADDGPTLPTQPPQRAHGPGSSDYSHAGFETSKFGQGARQYWLFTPKDPMPAEAPVVVFLHGWAAMEPAAYGAWIKHLVRRGNIVIYPKYQDGLGSLPNSFADNAVAAVHDAIAKLRAGSVQPDLDHLAFVGHSMGAIMSANIAQNPTRFDLPAPKCLFLAEPAFEPILGRYHQIEPATLIVVVVGSDAKRDGSAQRILCGSTRVPATNKNYVALASDLHGTPPLISDHFAPCSAETLDGSRGKVKGTEWQGRTRDVLDHFGYWKICDGLIDAAFRGVNREYALGDSQELRFMGTWSDGTPIEPARVLPIVDPAESASR